MAVALIVAAGRGERLKLDMPKALVMVAGKPMVHWSLDTVRSLDAVTDIALALPPETMARAGEEFPGIKCVTGGAVRSQSVRAALHAVGPGSPVIVHDAARPLAPATVFARALQEIERHRVDAVIAAAAVADTVKEIGSDGHTVRRTLGRTRLWAAQTPQVFGREALERVLRDSPEEVLAAATDEAWLIERAGGVVRIVASDELNFKVTTQTDLRLAELLLAGAGLAL